MAEIITAATTRSFSDVGSRTRTRVMFVYGLINQLPDSLAADRPLHTLLEFGRFAGHVRDASSLLPQILFETRLNGSVVGLPGTPGPLQLADATLVVTVTPRSDVTLVIDGVLPVTATSDEVADLLAATCFRRDELSVEAVPILEWVRQRIDPDGRRVQQLLCFGRDVHQMVFPGGNLLAEIRSFDHNQPAHLGHAVRQIIYRGTIHGGSAVRAPEILNISDHMVAHGRGVSVVAGWGLPVENCLALIAIILVSALGVVQRARRNAFLALSLNEKATLVSAADARSLVSRLSARLNHLQLDLSFGVEAYIDTVLVPEVLVGSFQSSLVDAIGLSDGLANTSRMLDRLHTVVQTRLSLLEAVALEQGDRRSKVLSSVVAVGSLIALPPTLLLAFFGINAVEVRGDDSMFDLSRYWAAYLLAWLPFVVLVVVGFTLTRRIRATSPHLRMHEELSSADRGNVDDLLPSQRSTEMSPTDRG